MTDSSSDTTKRDSAVGNNHPSYWRFAAMITTSMAAMFVLMYVHTFSLDHVRWSETRIYMAFVMGAAMAGIMLSVYRNRKVNLGIFVTSALVLVGAVWLIRSQETVLTGRT